jgi:glycosyltransferase involved in cell wall biosynthesis
MSSSRRASRLPDPSRISIDHFGRILDAAYAERVRQGARRVTLTLRGPFDTRDLASRFAAYDLMVFPSLFLETHGFAVDEAMALGLPVLVSDRGAPKERIGARGLTFPAGDAAALATILAGFLARPERLATLRRGPPGPRPTLAEHHELLTAVYARG